MKYPRTYHAKGSLGKETSEQIPLSAFPGPLLVVEEKLDGSQVSIRFEGRGKIVFQSRGHVLSGGPQEAEFAMFKPWAHAHAATLWERLGTRYIMYGEWLYAKHTVFYDRLPHYFLEFDIWDRDDQQWLSTIRRRALLAGAPIASVPVLYEGPIDDVAPLEDLIQPALYKSPTWEKALEQAAQQARVNVQQARRETELSPLPEGLYLKSETTDHTVGRYKWIRPDFLSTLLESESHWRDRPIIANQIAPGVDLYSPT